MKNKFIYWLLLPITILIGGLVYYPVIRTFVFSLYDYRLSHPQDTKFIGFDNYIEILSSREFYEALINTLVILLLVTGLVIIISLLIGSFLNIDTKFSGTLTVISMIPWALPPIVNGILWQFIFHPSYGYLNKFLIWIRLIEQPVQWTNNRWALLLVLSIVVSWRIVPFCSLLIMTTLKSLPTTWYEAALIDGAGRWGRWWNITLPYIKPTLYIILIQATMAAFNVFDEVVIFIGFRYEGQTLLLYNYLETFSFLNFGYGSAITYIIILLSGIIGYFYIRSLKGEGLQDEYQ